MEDSWSDIGAYSNLVNTGSLEIRKYQTNIIKVIGRGRNTLVVLPTGLGKTLIAVFAIAQALHKGKKAVFLAPTKPLSDQHYESLRSLLNINNDTVSLLTGSIRPKKRREVWGNSDVVVATPQTISNDAKSGNISFDDVGLVIFDECHRSIGRYAYTYIANECKLDGIQMVGLTASPGSDRKKIKELVDTLGIEVIEARSHTDGDVAPYVKGRRMRTIYVQKGGTIEHIASLLKPEIDKHLYKLYTMGITQFKKFENMPKGRIIDMGKRIDRIEARNYKFGAIFNYVYVLDLSHAYDLLTTEGLHPFLSYMESMKNKEKRSRSVDSILGNKSVVDAIKVATAAVKKGEEHPKMYELVDIMKGPFNSKKVIIFAQYRSTIEKIEKILNDNGIRSRRFMGKKEGVTRASQSVTIDDFRKGKFNVLVSTSIGEEGLDIPIVDAVIFYEPIPSAIRNIQRKGRAGRFKFGDVIILVTRDTRDETYLLVSRVRERRMAEILDRMAGELEKKGVMTGSGKTGQSKL